MVIRDEAHRFANGYHQLLMKQRMNESVLQASFEGDPPAVEPDAVIDTLVEVWYLASYGTVSAPQS